MAGAKTRILQIKFNKDKMYKSATPLKYHQGTFAGLIKKSFNKLKSD